MSPQPNISKSLQIHSAMQDSTIVSIVKKNRSSWLRGAEVLRLTWTGCLSLHQPALCLFKSFKNCLRWMLVETLALTEIASRRRHERRKGRAVDVKVA